MQSNPDVHVARSRGYDISYEDAGNGPCFVLINGTAGLASEWREDGFVERLMSSHRVLSVDPLGQGLSSKPHDDALYRWPDVADDIIAAMDLAGAARAALWGYSRGAALACTTAIEYPERVEALILGGEDVFSPLTPDPPPWAGALADGDWDPLLELLSDVPEIELRAMVESNDPKAVAASVIGARFSDYVMELSRVQARALVYCGGDDEPEALRPTADALGTELHVIGEGDHFATFHDVDGVMPAVSAFLEKAGS